MADSAKIGTKEFGDLLRTARERKGMSRNDLVEATGLSYPYISQLETAYRKPSPAAIRKLAGALDISLDDVFAALATPSPVTTEPPERVADGHWILNETFAGAGGPLPTETRFAVRGAMPAPAPHPAAASGASASGGGPPGSGPSVVEQVVRLLNQIPAEQRLDALAKVQTEVVESLIDDGIRRGDHRGRR